MYVVLCQGWEWFGGRLDMLHIGAHEGFQLRIWRCAAVVDLSVGACRVAEGQYGQRPSVLKNTESVADVCLVLG
jgi:hypothetical protein